ncbi:MAG: hypothetical protein CMM00_17030 [Rhodopirellula sp.]|jgi:hypothetical protein|uniref:Uncharacterized protein n=1 Tax=Rhodopirellula europaea SH398 TaxID=1263868 RepID=M5S2T7_9BACT|nr:MULTISPECIES: hypothetical protein [Rhodopirellula]EMI25938.1 hypothetical protein RESH_03559 [Rhodopirellula europaea SH398]MAP10391.1 hypothetical protein [Rhodopirellula sp.]|tara:strand:+ start:109 stop:375 length:267 start_codon:yes stop_codon:yes gene_type:complete
MEVPFALSSEAWESLLVEALSSPTKVIGGGTKESAVLYIGFPVAGVGNELAGRGQHAAQSCIDVHNSFLHRKSWWLDKLHASVRSIRE